jgi:hypothetical protein
LFSYQLTVAPPLPFKIPYNEIVDPATKFQPSPIKSKDVIAEVEAHNPAVMFCFADVALFS